MGWPALPEAVVSCPPGSGTTAHPAGRLGPTRWRFDPEIDRKTLAERGPIPPKAKSQERKASRHSDRGLGIPSCSRGLNFSCEPVSPSYPSSTHATRREEPIARQFRIKCRRWPSWVATRPESAVQFNHYIHHRILKSTFSCQEARFWDLESTFYPFNT